MEPFDFRIDLRPDVTLNEAQGLFEVHGTIRHGNAEAVPVGSAAGGPPLRIGYRLRAINGSKALLFEHRIQFAVERLEPDRPYDFMLPIPVASLGGGGASLIIDFLIESRYWFYERGRPPFKALLLPEGGGLRAVSSQPRPAPPVTVVEERPEMADPAQADSHAAERSYGKFDADLLPALAESLTSIAARYGNPMAVEFAYTYVLGRRADPAALAGKSTDLTAGRRGIEAICAELLGSEEYRGRDVGRLRDPRVTIKSWAHPERVMAVE